MNRTRLVVSLALAATVTVAAGACADSDDLALDPPTSAEVDIIESRYTPSEVVVGSGATVTFTNVDAFAHTVTGKVGTDAATFIDSGDMGEDVAYEVTFDAVGTYAYFCEIHPTMVATVTVV